MIDKEKYYSLPELCELHPLLKRKGKAWAWLQVKRGKLKAINTSATDNRARFLVKGTEALKFISDLENWRGNDKGPNNKRRTRPN